MQVEDLPAVYSSCYGENDNTIAIISLISSLSFDMIRKFHVFCPKEKAIKKIILYAVY